MLTLQGWLWQSLFVGFGGFLGAVARFGVNELVKRLLDSSPLAVFPFWTLIINISGAFIMTLFAAALAGRHTWCSPSLHLFFATGFCGAYTTFSTLAWETDRLFTHGHPWLGILNMTGTMLAGLLAVRLAIMTISLR